LTPIEIGRLRGCARSLAWCLGRDRRNSWEDFLQDALSRVVLGASESEFPKGTENEHRRRWRPARVHFLGFLFGVLRSMAFDEYRKSKNRRPEVELEESMSSVEMAHGWVAHDDLEETLTSAFSGEPEVLAVLDLRMDRLTGPEIQRQLGITEKRYAAVMKRIQRRTMALLRRRT